MYFDTHCHLNSDELYEDHDVFVQKALDNNVTNMVVVGYDLKSSQIAIELAKQYEFVYAMLRSEIIEHHPRNIKYRKEKEELFH